MIKKLLPLLMMTGLLLTACAPAAAPDTGGGEDEDSLSIVATTYPLYLFASEVTRGAEHVTVSLLLTQEVSCLHDYTLTVQDMKRLEQADVLVINGAGLDDFVADTLGALPQREAAILVNCSQGMPLLTAAEAHDHDDADHDDADHDSGALDPHYWMDPALAATAVKTIADSLTRLQPEEETLYRSNAEAAVLALQSARQDMQTRLEPLIARELITFHDGFQYFAEAFNFTILLSIEEEEGNEASAQVIAEAANLISGYGLPAIFTEVNSSDATAQAIARETGVAVYPLSMLMSGPTESPGIQRYLDGMNQNIDTILEAFP